MEEEIVCPAEDFFQILLDRLVAPLLPPKSSVLETPSLSQHQQVANQMHAVVLLYNYYHRKRHPSLEFLGFTSCCKLAIILKPALLAYMMLMRRRDYNRMLDLGGQLSLTEKAIKDACDISSTLYASKDVQGTDGWPTSKVTVLLVDSRKENCLLPFGSTTKRIRSAIERNLDAPVFNLATTVDQNNVDPLLQLSLSAIEEVAGVEKTELNVLERHTVYSLNEKKTAAHFLIVQFSQSIEDQVPIKDVIDSLQGPLVQRNSCGWMLTPVHEYLHLLPYAGFLSEWLSRVNIASSCKDTSSDVKVDYSVNKTGSVEIDKYVPTSDIKLWGDGNECSCFMAGPDKMEVDTSSNAEVHHLPSDKYVSSNDPKLVADDECSKSIGSVKVKMDNSYKDRSSAVKVNYLIMQTVTMETDNVSTSDINLAGPLYINQAHMIDSPMESNMTKDQLKEVADSQSKNYSSDLAQMIDSPMEPNKTKDEAEEVADLQSKNRKSGFSSGDSEASGNCVVESHQSNSRNVEKRISNLAAKRNASQQMPLEHLIQKRKKLAMQRSRIEEEKSRIEEELALCEEHLHTILNGAENDLEVKLQTVIEFSNEFCMTSTKEYLGRTCQQFEDPVALGAKGNRSSDAIIFMQDPCQELDALCCANNWKLPTYCVSPSKSNGKTSIP